MIIGTSKKKYAPLHYTLLDRAWHPLRLDWQGFGTIKKPISVPGFEHGLSGHNPIALALVSQPLP